MRNYVNTEKFMAWYRAAAKKPLDEAQVLNRLYEDYCRTLREEFVLSPEETVSGRAESYAYRCENIGCCGASTVYISF